MAHQIIKQPNGNFAIWSSVVDHFILVDATSEEMIEYYIKRETEDITERVNKTVTQLNNGENPYYQFAMDWEEALEQVKECHGEDDKTYQLIMKEI